MSYRLTQLSPQSTHGTNFKLAVQGPWNTSSKLQDMQFWRSWLELDSDREETPSRSRINWNTLLGLAVMAGISVGFWAGAGLLAARMLR